MMQLPTPTQAMTDEESRNGLDLSEIGYFGSFLNMFLRADRETESRMRWLERYVHAIGEHNTKWNYHAPERMLEVTAASMSVAGFTAVNQTTISEGGSSTVDMDASNNQAQPTTALRPKKDHGMATPRQGRNQRTEAGNSVEAGLLSAEQAEGVAEARKQAAKNKRRMEVDDGAPGASDPTKQRRIDRAEVATTPTHSSSESGHSSTRSGSKMHGGGKMNKKKSRNDTMVNSESDKTEVAKANIAALSDWEAMQQEYERTIAARREGKKPAKTEADEELELSDAEAPQASMELDYAKTAYKEITQWLIRDVFSDAGLHRCNLALEHARKTALGMSEDPTPLDEFRSISEPTLKVFARAYGNLRRAQGGEALVNQNQHARAAQFYRTWQQMLVAVKDRNSQTYREITEWARARDVSLSQGVGVKSLLWKWLIEYEYPGDHRMDQEKRKRAYNVIRNDIAVGERLHEVERLFGTGMFTLLPENAGRT